MWFQIRCFSSWVLEVKAASQKGQGKVSLSEIAPCIERAGVGGAAPASAWQLGQGRLRPPPQPTAPYPLAPLEMVLEPIDAGELQPAPRVWTLHPGVCLEFILPLVHQGELGVGKGGLLTLSCPGLRQPEPLTQRPAQACRLTGYRSPQPWDRSKMQATPSSGGARELSGAPQMWPTRRRPHHEGLRCRVARRHRLRARGWTCARQAEVGGTSRADPARAHPALGSSQGCLGGPGSRLSGAPSSSLPSGRWPGFQG